MISKSQLLELTSHAGPKACTHLRDKIEALFQNDEVVSTQRPAAPVRPAC